MGIRYRLERDGRDRVFGRCCRRLLFWRFHGENDRVSVGGPESGGHEGVQCAWRRKLGVLGQWVLEADSRIMFACESEVGGERYELCI